jgi:hypothetical protein
VTAAAKRGSSWRPWVWLCLGVALGVCAVSLWPRPWLAQLLGGLGCLAVALAARLEWRRARERFERERGER